RGILFQGDCVVVVLMNHFEKAFQSRIAGRREKYAVVATKEKLSIENQRVAIFCDGDFGALAANLLCEFRINVRRCVGTVERKTSRQSDLDRVVFRPGKVEVDWLLA